MERVIYKLPQLLHRNFIEKFSFKQIDDRASIVPLVAGLRKDVLGLISEGMALVWESYKLEQYVQRLSECVVAFQEKVCKKKSQLPPIDLKLLLK